MFLHALSPGLPLSQAPCGQLRRYSASCLLGGHGKIRCPCWPRQLTSAAPRASSVGGAAAPTERLCRGWAQVQKSPSRLWAGGMPHKQRKAGGGKKSETPSEDKRRGAWGLGLGHLHAVGQLPWRPPYSSLPAPAVAVGSCSEARFARHFTVVTFSSRCTPCPRCWEA